MEALIPDKRSIISGVRLLCLGLTLGLSAPAHAVTLDPFTGGWTSGSKDVPAPKGQTFTLPMSRLPSRAHWDRAVSVNLEPYTSFSLRLSIPQSEAVRAVTISFKSGSGWYSADAQLRGNGEQKILFARSDFRGENAPGSWKTIESIRLSFWNGKAIDTTVQLKELSATRDGLILLSAAENQLPAAERGMARSTNQRAGNWLHHLDISYGTLNESELAKLPALKANVVFLPFSPHISNAQVAHLETFVRGGGKLIVGYAHSERLAKLMQVRLGSLQTSRQVGKWDRLVFDGKNPTLPKQIFNHAWNLQAAHPVGKNSKALALWHNAKGESTGIPGVVQSTSGCWIGTRLLSGDRANKQRLLVGLLAQWMPSLREHQAAYGLMHFTRVSSQADFESTMQMFQSTKVDAATAARVSALLTQANRLYQQARNQYAAREFRESTLSCYRLKGLLITAQAMITPSKPHELRGIWDHNGVGLYSGSDSWERTAKLMEKNGFNAIFPNLLWGGKAHFPSKYLPESQTSKIFGDQLAACIKACRPRGIKVHVWKVCWKMEGAPARLMAQLKAQGRLQVDANGKTTPWLCPSHPANQEAEINSLLDVIKRYKVDGIHLDYIRYPDRNSCFSTTTRKAFEKYHGKKVPNWPKDVQLNGPLGKSFESFRAKEISGFVARLSKRLKAQQPKLQLSAAVFGKYPSCRASIGQDWVAWLKAGTVDFVCPMNYNENAAKFIQLVDAQNQLVGPGKVYPGVGVSASESQLNADQVLHQIELLRNRKNPGFLLFKLDSSLAENTLPVLGAGATREQAARER